MQRILCLACFVVSLFISLLVSSATCGAADRPNILFVLVDDQRNDTLGCAGHPFIKTPTIDKLAKQGVRFENAFVTTAICAASRASIFTGLTERTHGYTFGKPAISAAHAAASYPAMLRSAGYVTGHFGKYGIKIDAKPGELFDDFLSKDRPYFYRENDKNNPGRHVDEVATERTINFIQNASDDKPFCAQISFNSAHAEDRDKEPGKKGHFPAINEAMYLYDDMKMPPPRLADSKYFDALPSFLQTSMNKDRFHWRWDTPEKHELNLRAYCALISGVDIMVARIIATLEEKGIADNTVIIYAGDNGYYMGDRGLAGKWSHYEQSLRVPLIVYDPRRPPSQRDKVAKPMALNIDIPATILDVAGVDVPDHYQGRPLTPVLDGKTPDDWRTDFLCEHLMNHKSIPKWEGVRSETFIYGRYFEQDDPEVLHDLVNDPDELVNLAKDPEHAETLAEMRAKTDDYIKRYTK